MLASWRGWARALMRSVRAVYLAARHPATPWYARVLATLVAAYAFSPIDLIPDPIPVLGYLDDLVLLPLGIWLTLKLLPPAVWAECRARAAETEGAARPPSWKATAAAVVLVWVAAAVFVYRELWPALRGRLGG